MTERVRWGILGTATIARQAIIPAMQSPNYGATQVVVAIASRSLEKARAVAGQFAIARAYGDYDQLLADREVDAVYIPLPNHLHAPYAIRALQAGKHVLCEKPIALSAEEAEELAEAGRRAPRLKLMEAFMYRLHPRWQWTQRAVAAGELGPLTAIQSHFSFFDDDPASILHRADWGGGALLDIGCYSISLSRWLFQAEPRRIVGQQMIDPRFGVDRVTSGILEFDGGTSIFTCSTRTAPYQGVQIFGERGRIEMTMPFNPPIDRPTKLWIEREGTPEEIEFATCDQYGIQMEQFSRAILEDRPAPIPFDDAIANMRAIDALARSGKCGSWASP